MTDNTLTSRARSLSPTLLICVIAAGVAAIGLFLPSLSPVRASGEPYRATAPAGAGVEIVDFDYSGQLTVEPGQSIQVVNRDGAPHTLTASDGSFDTGVIDGGNTGVLVAPSSEGSFSFICTIHPSMSGELTVTS